MGIGANLINDPFPLLNLSFYAVKSSLCLQNSSIDIFMFPPKPIDCYRPPLLSPWYNHIWNIYLICLGANLNLFINKESATHKAMLQSSVQTPIFPNRGYRSPQSICFSMSLKSFSIKSILSLTKGINYVDAPKASQMANPKKQATLRFVL